MVRVIRPALLMLMLVAGAAACNSSMTSPSKTGATINGSVSASSSSESLTESQPASGPSDESATADSAPALTLVVTIEGSKLQATVDADGNFTLTGVPAGNVKLRFRGTGVDSIVIVPSVEGGQTITIVVSIKSGSDEGELEADDRSGTAGGLRQLEGRVDAVPPVTAPGTFVVNGKTVVTNASTVFTDHGSSATFSNVAVGVRVHVAGTPSGDTLVASTVMIQNTNAALPVVVNGIVQGFTGTTSSFSFTVDGTLVKGDTTTSFNGNSAFADLANGKRVEVKAVQGNGFVTATSIHVK